MDGMDYWRLCDELTVIQAALLIVGEDPAGAQEWVLGWNSEQRPKGFDAAFAALKNAVNSKTLSATIRHSSWERGWNEEPEEGLAAGRDKRGIQIIYVAFPDWGLSTLTVDDLKQWLKKRGFHSGFFFPLDTDAPDYLDRSHPRYAPKLAAAIQAWLSVGETSGKSPKQALEKWLREHAVEFGLTNEDGNPNNTGIEESAKVANWQPGGGAPKTPG